MVRNVKMTLPLFFHVCKMEHEILKISPSQLVFGNSIDHDFHSITSPKSNSTEYKYIDRIEHLSNFKKDW